MATFTERARPKVNLTLRVLGRRPDGYHAIESLVGFADAPADTISLDTAGKRGLTVTGAQAGALEGSNLLDLVTAVVGASAPGLVCDCAIVLDKSIPVAAGLGGGSADAGALLRALQRADPEAATRIDWQALAGRIGADVAVCLLDRGAVMWGIGEHVMPLALPTFHALIVAPAAPVAADKTARVFRALAAPALSGEPAPPALPGPWPDTAAAIADLAATGNDLEGPATRLYPDIGHVLGVLRAEPTVVLARMSGAGPSCFGLLRGPPRTGLADAITARCPGWVCWQATIGD